MTGTYATRANAARAAKTQAKKHFGDAYEAFEGVDFIIHPKGNCGGFRERYAFELIGAANKGAGQ